ncbi:hypothetical protein J6590_016551 [Homalodisca vitripennis]|nr:hypothetical protein J6590_016551 [Homalodisca vitripennis]
MDSFVEYCMNREPNIDVVITNSGIKTIVDIDRFKKDWILPVTIKNVPLENGELEKHFLSLGEIRRTNRREYATCADRLALASIGAGTLFDGIATFRFRRAAPKVLLKPALMAGGTRILGGGKCRGKTRKYNKATHQLNGRRDSAITLSTRPLDFDFCLRMGRGEIKKIVIIDKKLPTNVMSVHDHNVWHGKIAAKWALILASSPRLLQNDGVAAAAEKTATDTSDLREDFLRIGGGRSRSSTTPTATPSFTARSISFTRHKCDQVLCFPTLLLCSTYHTSGKVAIEEWLVRNVEREMSLHFFSFSTSLSLPPLPPALLSAGPK